MARSTKTQKALNLNAAHGLLARGSGVAEAATILARETGQSYPWIVRSTAMVNHYYVYGVDRDFGPFFIKFCTYFPFNAKL